MMKQDFDNQLTAANRYARRFKRVIDYIYSHLDEDPDLLTLAEVAALSPWHWHRVWQSAYGESVIASVKRLRLHRAAADLAYSDKSLAVIAERAGYSSTEAFSRSFKKSYKQSPSHYRGSVTEAQKQSLRNGSFLPGLKGINEMHEVDIQSVPSERLAIIGHTGSYMEIGKAFEHPIGYLVERDLIGHVGAMKGLYYSDPTSVPEKELQSAAAVVVGEAFPVDEPLEEVMSRGGDYAVLHYKGPYSEMRFAYEWLYGVWLPQSDREPDDGPCVEVYLNNPRDTEPTELMTDICLPLKPAR